MSESLYEGMGVFGHVPTPEERTCYNDSIRRNKGVFICTECAVCVDINDLKQDDIDIFYEPKFCPECGAKVVGYVDFS